MLPAPYRFLRFLFIATGAAYVVAISLAQFVYSAKFSSQFVNPIDTPKIWWLTYLSSVVQMIMGIVLAIRLAKPSYHLFLAGFLIFLGISDTFDRFINGTGVASDLMAVAITGITGLLFIYSMMRFAGRHTATEYGQYFLRRKRPGWYKKAVIFFSNDKPFWLLFALLLMALIFASGYAGPIVQYSINILILVAGLVYFRLSFYFAGRENRNRLGWLLWGLIATIFMYLVQLFLAILYTDLMLLRFVALALSSFVICFAFFMSIFFFRSTDARFVVRKTLIYGAILIAGLFVFGAVEHYLIHTIAHALHIQSSILNSCFGAAIALLIRPLHHKVEHWLSSRGKDKHEHGKVAEKVRV